MATNFYNEALIEAGLAMDNTDNRQWYTRPVVFVTEMERSILHYTNLLGFKQSWNYKEGEREIVTQVNRGSGCELILSEDRARAGKSRVFISLEAGDLTALQVELELKGVQTALSWWGYTVMVLVDPDGNEMMFPLEEGS